MTEPTITHSFSVTGQDSTGTQRKLDVIVTNEQTTQFQFLTTYPGAEPFKTTITLSQIGLAMLAHAVEALEGDLAIYALETRQ